MKRLLVVLLLFSADLRAEVVTYEFSGLIDRATPNWFVGIGDSFAGTFSYDTSTPRSNTGIEVSRFTYPVIAPPIQFSATIQAGQPITLTALSEPPFEVYQYSIRSTGLGKPETLFGGTTRVHTSDSSIIVQTMDVFFSDNDGLLLGGALDHLPLTLPPLSELTEATFSIGGNGTSASGSLTRLVPEPPTIVIATLGLLFFLITLLTTKVACRRWRESREYNEESFRRFLNDPHSCDPFER